MKSTNYTTEIISFLPEYAIHFKKLNEAWIKQYFKIEAMDTLILNDPKHYIVDQGGDILFVKYNGAIVGCCALIKAGPQEYELAKMAVDSTMQGKGLGYQLGSAVVERARALGGTHIFLESNRQLGPALRVYEKLGFREVPQPHSHYSRSDIRMAMEL